MHVLLVLLGFYIITANSYVVVQVKKSDDSLSNIDAIIHKKIPSDKLSEFTDKLSRKHYKRFEVRKRADETEDNMKNVENTNANQNKNIDSLLFSINTGVNPDEYTPSSGRSPDAIDKLHEVISHLAKAKHNPIYRAQEEYQIKPEIVHFKSAKPALKFEINSDSIIRVIQDLLMSDTVKQYTDIAARKAAVVYRTIKEEMRKDDLE